MSGDNAAHGPYKVEIGVQKWGPGRDPGDGEPDETVAHVEWHEADGTPVTEPGRIAALNDALAATYGG